ncbi:hypothetical protein K402DRAFT_394550 [Aulographum hederae CBS 113979]|uniref:Cryptic loci regulator 2 N-terminal domain-containing protein n=1 Tax=Aulographum hederae CBS 113979 TaxID=1176131 RepID=A0A6G1GXU2_9PEZI|nr:hypothetical protein K402DRAFT_394550 [Aulographum hederae CBS 113979]
MSAGGVTVPVIPGASDGDPTHRPKPEWRLVKNPVLYLEKVGTMWMQQRGEALAGIHYFLDSLPAGYALFERPRPANPKHIDKHLYGHPSHKFFDSPNRFYPHFEYLMRNGNAVGCPCVLCRPGSKTKGPGLPNGVSSSPKAVAVRPKGRPKVLPYLGPVDEEGTSDVYRKLINKLKKEGTLNEPIVENMSMDWRAEKELIPKSLDMLKIESWIPRVGELVLMVRDIGSDEEIVFNDGEYKISNAQHQVSGFPHWEAGVVGQIPENVQSLKLDDHLTGAAMKAKHINYSGFRVEVYPDPNSLNKAYSKQYKYVPHNHIRPFVFLDELLRGMPQNKQHPSIRHARTAMSAISLGKKFHFKGTWPTAEISCKSMFMGSELFLLGDCVRLLPTNEQPGVTDVLKITDITLKMTNLDQASDDDHDEGHPYQSAIHVAGIMYTEDPKRSYHNIACPKKDLPKPLQSYDEFFLKRKSGAKTLIPFQRLFSRCYPATAMTHWFPSSDTIDAIADLSKGLAGTLSARKFSATNYHKMSDGHKWFWADTRVQALDLHTINGVETAEYDESREPERWRKELKVLDGTAGEAERAALVREEREKEVGRKSLRGFAAAGSALVGVGLGVAVEVGGSASGSGSGGGKDVIMIDDDDDEEDGLDMDVGRTVDELAQRLGQGFEDDDDDSSVGSIAKKIRTGIS